MSGESARASRGGVAAARHVVASLLVVAAGTVPASGLPFPFSGPTAARAAAQEVPEGVTAESNGMVHRSVSSSVMAALGVSAGETQADHGVTPSPPIDVANRQRQRIV